MAGCGPQGVTEKRFSNPPPDAITRATVLIQGYADGQPVGSEAVEFEESLRVSLRSMPRKGVTSKTSLPKLKRQDV